MKTGEMKLHMEMINKGEGSLPYGLGWHPYFKVGNLDKAAVKMPVEDTFLVDDRMIPEKRQNSDLDETFEVAGRSFDEAFTLKQGSCSLETERYRLDMVFDARAEAYLQIYTPPHRNSIAIEPMTCLADAFNNGIGLQILEPGASDEWNVSMRWQIKQ